MHIRGGSNSTEMNEKLTKMNEKLTEMKEKSTDMNEKLTEMIEKLTEMNDHAQALTTRSARPSHSLRASSNR